MAMAYQDQIAANAAPKPDNIATTLTEIERQIDRLSKLKDAIYRIGDNLVGPAPQAVDTTVADTPPHSLHDNVRRKERAMANLISQTEEGVHRITLALGM